MNSHFGSEADTVSSARKTFQTGHALQPEAFYTICEDNNAFYCSNKGADLAVDLTQYKCQTNLGKKKKNRRIQLAGL